MASSPYAGEIVLDSQTRESSTPKTTRDKSRVRTGCMVCRVRKVKCDEMRPSCENCIRRNKTCVYKLPQRWAREQPLLAETSSISDTRDASQTGNVIGQSDRHLQNAADAHEISPNQPSEAEADGSSISAEATDRFHRASQLIYLSTSLDWLAASQTPTTSSFTYFTQEVDSPFLSPFDSLNWMRMKEYLIPLGVQYDAVAKSMLAVQVLHRAQVDRLPTAHAMSVFQDAIASFESISGNEVTEFRIVLVVAFLLCLAVATLPNDDGPALSVLDGPFSMRLEKWLVGEHKSSVALRIYVWIRCLNISTKRSGSIGLFSQPLSKLIGNHTWTVSSLSELDNDTSPEHSLYDTVSTPLFAFYVEVQKMSNRVADVTHYRRSRTTPADQAEATYILAAVEFDMCLLWENRPAQLRLQPEELRQHFSAQIARPLIALAGLCLAAFHTETVTIVRIRGDSQFPSPKSEHALRQIRGIVEGDWNASEGGTLNPGYLRPIFMYALESSQEEDTQWAADRLRQIKNPISRSNFLASFVEVHGEQQRSQGRRITMKYFCYQTFGVPLPFM